MTSLQNIEEFLEIDLTQKQLRLGKKNPLKNRYYWFTKQYYIVQLSGNDNWCIMSSNQTTRDLLTEHVWRCGSGYAITDVRDEDGNKTTQKFHRLAIDCADDMVVDHINRHRYDNRTDNLREVTSGENMKNITKRSDHTSGKNGIRNTTMGKNNYWRAQISDNGNRKHKCFSINKLGEAEAKRLAIEWRQQHEVLLGYIGE